MNSVQSSEEQVFRTICNSHCGGLCEIQVHVRGDKIIRIEPVDRGELHHRACARGRAYRQRVYSPDRLLYPLKRTGKRGAGEFTRVSWEEALELVASQLKRVKATCGPAAILHFCSMADAFTLHHVQAIHRLLCQFGGYTAPWGAISDEGLNFSSGVTYGTRPRNGIEGMLSDFPDARLIIMWGWNPTVTSQGTDTPLALARARERGARIVAVDPRYTDSAAAFADRWIPIRPGTDVAALIAMAYVIISEDLLDKPFLDTYTAGFDRFKDYVLGLEDGVKKTPEWAGPICGIKAETIANLAREYAGAGPAALASGYAAGRTAYGEQFHRAISTLEAITGNTPIPNPSPGHPGLRALRNAVLPTSPPNPVEMGVPPRWNALPYRGASVNSSARVNVSQFADAILKGKAGGYPADYKFLWLSNTNYLNQLGDVNKTVQAFQQLDFILVTEQFMTATARYADIVLPVCTYLERYDILASRDGRSYGLVNKTIEPLGESKSQLQICEALSLKLGISDYNDKSDEEWVMSIVAKLSQVDAIPDYDTFRKRGIFRLQPGKPATKQAEDRGRKLFPTPSGKIEIYSREAAEMNHPLISPIPKYYETWEGLNDPLAGEYPLQLITPHFGWRAHSQFHNLPWLRELQSQEVNINSRDAMSRGIREGDMVRVFNMRGEMRIPAHVTERIMPGVVEIPQGAWYRPDANGVDYGGCPNVLTSNVVSPAGAFTSSTTLVQVKRIQ